MEQEDGLVASVRALLEAELGKEPNPRAGSGAARRIDELRAMLATAEQRASATAAALAEAAAQAASAVAAAHGERR